MTENQANILDTLWVPLPIPKYNVWDAILYSYSWEYFIYKIVWIRFTKCRDWYFIEYETFRDVICEGFIILSIKNETK